MSAEGMKAMCWLAMYALAFALAPLSHTAAGPNAPTSAITDTQAEA